MFLAVILIVVILAIILPFGIMGIRVSDTWTHESTGQLLGGALACLGAMGAMFGMLLGAGIFARLAGWKPPRREEERPSVYIDPRGWDEQPRLSATNAVPPWGLTGGGQYELLPAPPQDVRFSMSAPAPDLAERGARVVGERGRQDALG